MCDCSRVKPSACSGAAFGAEGDACRGRCGRSGGGYSPRWLGAAGRTELEQVHGIDRIADRLLDIYAGSS
jgi:hypothetical protein